MRPHWFEMKEISTPVTRYLDERLIPYRLFQHSGPVHSIEEAARQRGERPEQIVRSILFRLSSEEFLMVLIAGPQQISWKALRVFLNQSRLTTATEEEVIRVTGYQIGAVSPFGLPQPVRTLVDESVLAEEEISIGSGQRGLAVILWKKDFLQAMGHIEAGQFAE
jgi:Cys-tRNA(Pro)/Cys-tRNA(Cys) deacylase